METISKTSHLPINLRPIDDHEMELLIHCARASLEPERAERIRALVTAGLNWTRLWNLSQRNGLSPLLYFHLNQTCAASVPPEQIEFLRDYFQKNSAFSVLLTGELVRLLKAFAENGIKAVPYKGPAIAVKLYGNLALRQFCDLDILVRESDVWRASEIIMAQGFEPHFLIPETRQAAFVRLSYVQLFRRDAGRTLIELHWGIAPRFFAVKFDADAFWRRLEPMSLQGTTVLTPCAEDLLLMLCVHGAKDCWEKLEWVCSIAELLGREQNLDWELMFQRARQMHCQRMLVFGLLLAQGLFEVPLPSQAVAFSRSRKLLKIAKQVAQDFCSDEVRARPFSRRLGLHLSLKDNFTDRARHCVRLALTTTPVDWSTMPLPGPLSFAYPLLRALRLTRKYGLKHEQAAVRVTPRSNKAA